MKRLAWVVGCSVALVACQAAPTVGTRVTPSGAAAKPTGGATATKPAANLGGGVAGASAGGAAARVAPATLSGQVMAPKGLVALGASASAKGYALAQAEAKATAEAPLAGAEVVVRDAKGNQVEVTRTDEQGRYQVRLAANTGAKLEVKAQNGQGEPTTLIALVTTGKPGSQQVRQVDMATTMATLSCEDELKDWKGIDNEAFDQLVQGFDRALDDRGFPDLNDPSAWDGYAEDLQRTLAELRTAIQSLVQELAVVTQQLDALHGGSLADCEEVRKGLQASGIDVADMDCGAAFVGIGPAGVSAGGSEGEVSIGAKGELAATGDGGSVQLGDAGVGVRGEEGSVQTGAGGTLVNGGQGQVGLGANGELAVTGTPSLDDEE